MDVSLWAALPQLGVGGALVAVIVYLLRANHIDRKQYADLREKAEVERDRDVAELREQIAELREEVRRALANLEIERRARWAAEDTAARYRRLAGVSDDGGDTAQG